MRTQYIGEFQSENGKTGRGMRTELAVEPSEIGGHAVQIEVRGYNTGDVIRTLYLDRGHVEELRDALQMWLNENPGEA